jgi:hypothetical protein
VEVHFCFFELIGGDGGVAGCAPGPGGGDTHHAELHPVHAPAPASLRAAAQGATSRSCARRDVTGDGGPKLLLADVNPKLNPKPYTLNPSRTRLCDVTGDGDPKLLVADQNRKLRLYKGINLVSEHALVRSRFRVTVEGLVFRQALARALEFKFRGSEFRYARCAVTPVRPCRLSLAALSAVPAARSRRLPRVL